MFSKALRCEIKVLIHVHIMIYIDGVQILTISLHHQIVSCEIDEEICILFLESECPLPASSHTFVEYSFEISLIPIISLLRLSTNLKLYNCYAI